MKRDRLHIHFWEQAPVFRLLLPLVAGILLYDRYGQGRFWLLLVSVFLLYFFLGQLRYHKLRLHLLYFMSVQFLLAAMGYALCGQADERNDPDWLGNRHESRKADLAVLTRDPVPGANSLRLELSLLGGIDGKGQYKRITGKALAYLPGTEPFDLSGGDTILLPARWQPIRNSGNPFEFDYARWCRRKNVYHRQFAARDQVCLAGKCHPASRSFIERSHYYCIQAIDQSVTDSVTAALLKAVIAGDESGIDPELRQAYSDTGIIHIISVSGSHVNLLFLSVAFLLRFIRNRRFRWIQFCASFILIWIYVLIAGAAAPAIRAALMFSIVAGGTLLDRSANPLNQLCTAGFVMLLYQPAWLFAAGFQLSFLAILSIILFYSPIRDLLKPRSGILRWLWSSLALSLAAEILIAPLAVYYFHSFPATFLVANIIACLAMSVILILGILLLLLAPFPVLASLPVFLLTRISHWFHACIFFLQEISPVSLRQLQLSPLGLLLLYTCIAAAGILLIGRDKRSVWISLAALLLLVLLDLRASRLSATQRILLVYSGRAGQVELLEGGGYRLLCGDTAESMSRSLVHNGYRCHRRLSGYGPDLLLVGNKRVLLLGKQVGARQHFPVDIVVLKSNTTTTTAVQIKEAFHPELLVISGAVSRKRTEELKAGCRRLGLAYHDTREQGAFLLR